MVQDDHVLVGIQLALQNGVEVLLQPLERRFILFFNGFFQSVEHFQLAVDDGLIQGLLTPKMIGDQGAVAAGQPTDFLDGDIVVSFFVE